MAEPARKQPAAPPLDPGAVERAYRLERARRRARLERSRRSREASLRFAVALVVLLGLALVLALAAWREIQRLFGL